MKSRLASGLALLVVLAPGARAQCELVKLQASDGISGSYFETDAFGSSLDLEGRRLLASAPGSGPGYPSSGYPFIGGAYVFEETPFGWLEVGKLSTAPDAPGSCALSAGLAAVGSSRNDSAGTDAGIVRIFALGAQGWIEDQLIHPNDPHDGDWFGNSTGLDGNRLLVGAGKGDGQAADSGSAYVFERGPEGWKQVAKLAASDGALDDRFGSVVALAGNTALVGAPLADEAGPQSGAAYVFEHGPAGWTQVAKLMASDANQNGRFGSAVEVDGDFAFVSAMWAAAGPGEPLILGAVYVFRRSPAGWTEVQRLTVPLVPHETTGFFGTTLSASDDRLLVGSNRRRAYLYEHDPDSTSWVPTQTLYSPGIGSGPFAEYYGLGGGVALSGDVAAVNNWLSYELYVIQGKVSVFTLATDTCVSPVPIVLSASPLVPTPRLGWTQAMKLASGPYYAGDIYFLLGSASGSAPGVDVEHVHLPLNPDAYFLHTLSSPNAGLFTTSLGLLDAAGSAQASLGVPPEAAAILVGAQLNHAALVLRTVDGVTYPMDASNAVALTFPAAPVPPLQLLSEDFESGATSWTFENAFFGLWHLAPPGECGALTTMATYNAGPASCDYQGGLLGTSGGGLRSPPILLSGQPPYVVSFTSGLALDGTTNDKALVVLLDTQSGETLLLADQADLENGGTPFPVYLPIPDSAAWSGRTVRLLFSFGAQGPENDALGWLVDDVRVTAFAP